MRNCPRCGGEAVFVNDTSTLGLSIVYRVRCNDCGLTTTNHFTGDMAIEEWNSLASNLSKRDPDPNNPYTDFAKEMSLLHEALKAECFGDAMVDILAMMTPVIWDKVEKRRIHENLVKAVDELEKQDYKPPAWIEKLNEKNQKREDEAWKEARKRVLCE